MKSLGMPATCGFPHLAKHVPVRDADSVARLRAAGAISVRQDERAARGGGSSELQPGLRQVEQSRGMSGARRAVRRAAAAAVAAGFSALELGSDIGGVDSLSGAFLRACTGTRAVMGSCRCAGTFRRCRVRSSCRRWGLVGRLRAARRISNWRLMCSLRRLRAERTAWSVKISASRREKLSEFRVALWADQKSFSVDRRCLDAMHEFARRSAAARRAGG